MSISQSQNAEEDPQVTLSDNTFVPPMGDICYINDLPPELLSRIFEVGSADDDDEDEQDGEAEAWEEECQDQSSDEEETDDEGDSDTSGSSDIRVPMNPSGLPFFLVASHVCRHWRNVAITTPSLWTSILVSSRARPPYEYQSALLERSKSLPVDICVDCQPIEEFPHSQAPSPSDLTALYSILVAHIQRWRTIVVTVDNYPLMHVFLTAVSNPVVSGAPQLTTLELYDHQETEDFETFEYPCLSEHFILFGGSAPLLNRIILWGVHVDWNQSWTASASNLTELELAYHAEDIRPSWAQFVTILRGAVSLEKLSLRLSGPLREPQDWFIEPAPGDIVDSKANAPIELPRVTDFILAFQSPARAIGLIRKLNLSALKHLGLDFDDLDYTDLVHELAKVRPASSLLPREQPRSLLSRLETFKIAGLPCRSECIPTLYGELQNLKSLNLSLTHLEPVFLDILCTPCALPGRGDIWLPRLETLYISGVSGASLREVVGKRRDAGVPISRLYVEETCDLEEEDVKWLRSNVKKFDFFEGSDDEDVFEDLDEEVDEWSDADD